MFFLKLIGDSSIKEKVLFIYYLFATILAFIAYYIYVYMPADVDNNWVYNILYFITICILSYYFYHVLNNKIKKNIVIFLFIVNLILFMVFDIVLHRFYVFNEYVYAICFLSIVVYSLFYFDQLLRNVTELNILFQFDFWLISGYLLYFLGCFFIILYYLTIPVTERGPTWALQNIILLLSSVITLTGYLRIRYRKTV